MTKENLTGKESGIIREAKIEDTEAILDIQKHDGYNHAYYLTPKRVEKLFSKKQKFYLVEDNAKSVGFACVDFDVRTWIHFFSVLKDFQKKNVGSFLLEKIIEESRQRNIDLLYAVTGADSDSLIKFFKKYNFGEAGFHKDRFGQGKDGLIWNLKI